VTQLVDFLFSTGGFVSVLACVLLWLRLRDRSRLARRFLVLIVVGYGAASIYPISSSAGRLLTRGFRPFTGADVPRGRTALILLGSSAYSARDWEENVLSTLDRTGSERAVEGARVYHLVKPEWVISSGGRVYADDRNAPSAEAMRDTLIKLGVPDSRILVSAKPRTTHEEAVGVRGMLTSIPADHVVLVTSDLHMRRSLGAFRAEGIQAIPAITRRPRPRPPWNLTWLPSEAGLAEAHDVAHEFLGICYYLARGWFRFR
jgi:uncharacterized SAM-binding protein YcdF (DUF218 family)